MTTFTGRGITVFQLLAMRGAVKLEGLGMKHSSGRSVTAHAKRILGLKHSTPRAEVLAALDARIESERSQLVPGEITS